MSANTPNSLAKQLFPTQNTPLAYPPGTGKIGSMNAEQEEAFKVFKEEAVKQSFYNEKRHTDFYLLRFLRARKFNLQASFQMLEENELWRQKNDVDNLTKTFEMPNKRDFLKFYPRTYHKCDKHGNPVYIEILGDLNVAKIENLLAPGETDKNAKHEKALGLMLKQTIVGYEFLETVIFPYCSKEQGKCIEQCFTILDLKNLSLSQASSGMSFIKETSKIAQNYYPETMFKMFIINAPLLFRGFWSMIKGFLDPVTTSKITILGGSYKDELLKYVDEEQLPKMFGGKCECIGGCQYSNTGPWNVQTEENEETEQKT